MPAGRSPEIDDFLRFSSGIPRGMLFNADTPLGTAVFSGAVDALIAGYFVHGMHFGDLHPGVQLN